MIAKTNAARRFSRGIALAALVVAGMTGFGSLASAAGCPAGKMGADVRAMNSTPGKGVTDSVLASIDLSKEMLALADHSLRLRKLVIKPGGVVPWHSHGDRPAIIYIIQGTIVEYASNCSVPIVHRPGDVTMESHATAHWWKNTGRQTVILLSADILHDKSDHNM